MKTILSVALGSALGGVLRYSFSFLFPPRLPLSFPWETLSVNVLGCFVMGLLWARSSLDPFWSIGVLGGFTTFSAFSLQTLLLLQERQLFLACAYACVSVMACLTAVWLGMKAYG